MRLAGGVLLVCLAFTGQARAAFVDSFSASGYACSFPLIYGSYTCNNVSSPDSGITVVAPGGAFAATASAGGYAASGPGSVTLGVMASASGSSCFSGDCGGYSGASVSASASLSDSILISGDTGTGQLSYTLNEQVVDGACYGCDGPLYTVGSTLPSTFTYGMPFMIGLSIDESVGVVNNHEQGVRVTYSLSSISVLDTSGDPVTDYFYQDDSGGLYPFAGGSYGLAPESPSLILGALGLILLAWRIRRIAGGGDIVL